MPMVPMPGALFHQQSRSQRVDRENSGANRYPDDDSSADFRERDMSQKSSISTSQKQNDASTPNKRKASTSSLSIEEYKKQYEMALKSNSEQSIKPGSRKLTCEDASGKNKECHSSKHSTNGTGLNVRKPRKSSQKDEIVPRPSTSTENFAYADVDTNETNAEDRQAESSYENNYKHYGADNNDSRLTASQNPDDVGATRKTPYERKQRTGRNRRSSVEGRTVTTTSSRENSTGGGAGYRSRTSGGMTGREIGLEATVPRYSLQSCQGDGASLPSAQTIALLGASGMTGSRFLHSALDSGYEVRCLPSDDPRQTSGKCTLWKILQAEMEDTQQLEILLKGVSFVVVMINDLLPRKNSDYPSLFLTKLVSKLYAMMRREEKMQVFLLQSTSLASDVTGQTPVFSKLVKTTTRRRDQFMIDLDAVMKRIAVEHGMRPRQNVENQDPNPEQPNFSFVVTRPTILLQNGPGCKRLFASKSQPGPVPISHVDLAEFTLSALTNTKIQNSSPYVVADCF
ncbi:hypothetical protein ACA910_017719 [Epithemia clementina (nom. ined.)]